ncbi:hypothetical protein [Streptomyces erythrochromogenes]|uniref:hypothetical protein n=1 Tax=Streptomyces erythrochromogenes TaxID=285574 RepID=UPI0022587BEE|nr:hypothetical protein [Streptomyces erythrochromogenes]MCX5584272.1 hypothetical protein [Streptomyces erythrochromogenes]
MDGVADATRAEIERLNVAAIAPGLAALAITLAEHLDGADAPTSAAVVGRELRATLDKLRAVAPGKAEGDELDDLAARRAARRGA